MVDMTNTVGDLGSNTSEDVALVQLMLRVVKNAKGQPYFSEDYNGTYSQALKTAILAFQQDQKLVAAKTSAAAGLAEKPGLIGPDSKTLTALVSQLPAELKNIRIAPGTKTIYLEGNQSQAERSAALIRSNSNLNADFREKVAQLVNTMYKNHKIALNVVPQTGWRRDFAAQAEVSKKTNAGPGESPHQFGRAVDIGFKDFKWVAGDGAINTDSFGLDTRGMPEARRMELWAARNAIAYKQLGLFKTNKPFDYIHVQGFADEKVGWGKSLAKLLETVSPAKAKWSHAGRVADKNVYKIDPGLGTALSVGTSTQMWNGAAPINKAELVKALNAKLTADPNFSVEKFFGVTPPPAVSPADKKTDTKTTPAQKAAPLKEADVKEDYIKFLQKLIKTEMQTADQNWDAWVPTK
ncbi:MAG: hypothetical protein HY080_03960 [Gammaproteobacteria bacterium]|nr:hypothetical protein [Gammaproteobacteria bacterium]